MIADRLVAIEERLAAATPGPWACWNTYSNGDYVCIERIGPAGEGGITTHQGTAELLLTKGDAELIAHAPSDLADLLAVARAARSLLTGQPSVAFDGWRGANLRNALDRL